MSLVMHPPLLDNPRITNELPEDAVARARMYIENMPGGLGAYSESKGHYVIRKEIADMIENRDGVGKVDPENIFLTKGASAGVEMLLLALIRDN
mmetsp:Transcript_5389/g.3111  ORF Transcript_5389/g.3111 Transcript_5389/m.3111 type:complete len:94 (+) Transcript_5389:213-494(+)